MASRILLCCEHYAPSVGGVQEVMRQIGERLAAKGHEVTVATTSHPQRHPDIVRNGVRIVSFPIHGNLVRGISGPVGLYQSFLREHACDAVLIKAAQQWTFDAAIEMLPLLSARKLFVPCGFSGLSQPAYARYYADMPKWLALFDALIFYSDRYQDIEFARRNGLKRLHCVPNGVDEREFSNPDSHAIRTELGIDPNHDLILSVGSMIAAKGHWEVIRAFAAARLTRATTLVINGNAPSTDITTRLKRTIKHALSRRWPLSWEAKWAQSGSSWRGAAPKRVVLTDLGRPDLVNLYKAADLFVLASHVEYSPLVLFEAAAAGTPFLASPAGNTREIAAWTGAGHVMENDGRADAAIPVPTLARELERMLADKARLSTLGAAGRHAVFERGFTWEKIVDQYWRLLGA